MDTPHYPSAHSMDSCWFAVDRDGFVAYFSTGESGAMPLSGYRAEEAEVLRSWLIRDLPTGDVLHDPNGHDLPGESVPRYHLDPSNDFATVVFLSCLAPVQSDIEAGRVTAVRATEGYAVIFPILSPEQVRRLTESGAVRSHTYYFDDEVSGANNLARHGIYEYGHLCENWIAGPYGRKAVPARPIHVDQLPPNIRRKLTGTLLTDHTFAKTVHIQPAEHWYCESWEPGWLGLDGVRRPFAGREADFEQQEEES
jgi:hypothetical protein